MVPIEDAKYCCVKNYEVLQGNGVHITSILWLHLVIIINV